MSAKKTYAWERATFSWHYAVEIAPQYRMLVAIELAKKFGIKNMVVQCTRRGGGDANVQAAVIRLPSWRHPCSLGLILHEIAHVYDWRHYEGNGHRASFKKAMIRLAVETRTMKLLVPIFASIRYERAEERSMRAASALRAHKAMAAAQRATDKKSAMKALRKTPQYRLAATEERINRLKTRMKRLASALRKAERQQRALARRAALPSPVAVPT